MKALLKQISLYLLSRFSIRIIVLTCPDNKQGSKLKKKLGRLLATNWRILVARCKFQVASLCNQNNIWVLLVESV